MQIYYFTRTGRSQEIAVALAARQGEAPCAITDEKHWAGPIGFARGAWAGLRGKSLPAVYEKPAENQTVALVFPLWAGGFPPAVRRFTEEVGRGKIVAIPTSLGSMLKDRVGFERVIDLVGKEITAPEELK